MKKVMTYKGKKYPIKLEPNPSEEGNYFLSVYFEENYVWEDLGEIYEIVVNGEKYWTFNQVFINLFKLEEWYDKKYESVEDIVRELFELQDKYC